MPSYYHDSTPRHHHHRQRHHSSSMNDGYELAQYLGRELQHSSKPTRFIINEGKMVIDERALEGVGASTHSLRHSLFGKMGGVGGGSTSKANTVVYNAPGSTMRIEHSDSINNSVGNSLAKHYCSNDGPSSRYFDSLSLSVTTTGAECKGCFRLREKCYGGYCSNCLLDREQERERERGVRRYDELMYDDDHVRIVEVPDRKVLAWR